MTSRTFIGDSFAPSLADRKQAMFSSKEFISSVNVVLSSTNRISGSLNACKFNLPTPIRGVYAASLKSISLPFNFGNVLSPLSFTVTYTNVVAFPGSFTLSAGYYWYDINAGTVTYATASATPTSNNLIYYILNYFSGGLTSITVNPLNGSWNWAWDSSTGGVASTNVPSFFQFGLTSLSGLNWLGNGNPIDLSGCKNVAIQIQELSYVSYQSTVLSNPGYFVTVPVNCDFGQVLSYQPIREDICYLDSQGDIGTLSVNIVDGATNSNLPLVSNWIIELRLYVIRNQL
jgi:hypothetical protein